MGHTVCKQNKMETKVLVLIHDLIFRVPEKEVITSSQLCLLSNTHCI